MKKAEMFGKERPWQLCQAASRLEPWLGTISCVICRRKTPFPLSFSASFGSWCEEAILYLPSSEMDSIYFVPIVSLHLRRRSVFLNEVIDEDSGNCGTKLSVNSMWLKDRRDEDQIDVTDCTVWKEMRREPRSFLIRTKVTWWDSYRFVYIATIRSQINMTSVSFTTHHNSTHTNSIKMSYNPRMSMAPPNSQQQNRGGKKKEEDSDAFMRLVNPTLNTQFSFSILTD